MMSLMRTTITLGSEAEALVKQAMADRKLSFKERGERGHRPWSRGRSRALRVSHPTACDGGRSVNLDKATQLAGELEDEEILRKMALGK